MQVKFVGKRQKKTLHPVLKSYLCGYLSSAAFVTAPRLFYFEFYSASFSDGAIFNVKSSI